MPKFKITVNVPALDADGVDHRARKTIDLWDRLTATQQTTLTNIHQRIQDAVNDRYGVDGRVEAMEYEAD